MWTWDTALAGTKTRGFSVNLPIQGTGPDESRTQRAQTAVFLATAQPFDLILGSFFSGFFEIGPKGDTPN